MSLYSSKWFRRLSVVMIVLLLGSLLASNFLASSNGEIWIGDNYWNQPITAWGQLIVLVVITAAGIYWLIRNHRWWL